MVLTKEEIWDRIRIKSVWLMTTRTPIFVAGEEHMAPAANTIAERFRRYVVMLLFQGNAIVAQSGCIEKLHEDGTYEVLISDVQIQPAAMPQIPNGGLDITSPFIVLEGGTGLYGHVNGNSINLSIVSWDSDI
jgi:hypothetical protein